MNKLEQKSDNTQKKIEIDKARKPITYVLKTTEIFEERR